MLRLQLCISKCFPVDKIRLINRRVFKGIIQYVHPTKYFLFEKNVGYQKWSINPNKVS